MKERPWAGGPRRNRRWTFFNMDSDSSGSRLVYSTSCGPVCPQCGQAAKACVCSALAKQRLPDTDGLARISYEHRAPKGKGVTLIKGLLLNQPELLTLAKKLKQRFGTGGTVEGWNILLQGDFRIPAARELGRLGFRVK